MANGKSEQLGKASRPPRRLLALLAGLPLTLAAIVSGASSTTAQNAVGPQPVVSILTVGPTSTTTPGSVGVRGPPQLRPVSATGVAAKTAPESTAVIGKVKDLGKVGDSEYTLLDRLPDLGSPKANWKQNSGVLRQEMGRGLPIRDASVDAGGRLIQYPGSFLNAERYAAVSWLVL